MRTRFRILMLISIVASAASCGDASRSSRGPMQLVIQSLTVTSSGGVHANTFSTVLDSAITTRITTPDPCTTTSPCNVVFDDLGKLTLSLENKNPSITPSGLNTVTTDRVHVKYVRADGHNTQGVDVPFEFDVPVTVTVPLNGTADAGFEIVRHDAKRESPLIQLLNSSEVITTFAQVTVYGHDQAGNIVSATGQIQINFGDFLNA